MIKIFLFDVDGTLTKPRQKITEDMVGFIRELKQSGVITGIVSGSDLKKIEEQIGNELFNIFSYVFSENGLVYHKNGELRHKKDLRSYFTQTQLNKFINRTLILIANTDIPIKTGTFIEYRNGMLNISPIGRGCSVEERNDFEKLDAQLNIRQKIINQLKQEFTDMDLEYSIGGQISFDVFPVGTNKTFCLSFLIDDLKLNFDQYEIHFFGDKTFKGGNDHEIFIDPRVIGHSVINYTDTIKLCLDIYGNELGLYGQ